MSLFIETTVTSPWMNYRLIIASPVCNLWAKNASTFPITDSWPMRFDPGLRAGLLRVRAIQIGYPKSCANSGHKKANISCAYVPLPEGFNRTYFVNSFVYTRAQVSAHFPGW